ncbi:MAG: hypothetical protein KJO29_07555 [Bacteroidia bacterium]|nr:hypothetical protein [Bacteroidia bacterium]
MLAKKAILIFIISASGIHLSGQLYFGINASYSIPFTRSEEIKYDDAQDFLTYSLRFVELDVTPSLNTYIYYKNEIMYLQGGIGYRQIKTRFRSISYLEFGKQTPVETIKKTSYLMLPIHAGICFDRFKFGAGPVFGYIVDQNNIFEEIESFEERRRRLDTGFAFNFGITIYRFQLDLSYEYQFNSVGDYLYYRKDEKGFNNQAQFINLGLGLIF